MKRATKKQAILEVAVNLFASKGFTETSISEVAQSAGIAEGTIFYYFSNKEGLLIKSLEYIYHKIQESFEAYLRETHFDKGLDMLDGLLTSYLHLVVTQEFGFHLLHHRYPYDLATMNEVCRGILERLYTYVVHLFESAILRGQDDGSIEKKINSKQSALILYAMIDGIARLNTFRVYHPGALINELQILYKRMLVAA